jgi:hypothetical protein
MFSKLRKLLVAALVLSSMMAHASDDPLDDPAMQRVLRGLRGVSTNWHPDLFGMTVGLRRYVHGEYKGALKYFEIGAYYADKLSQLCIGLMYMNGEGVAKDPITAYAWMALAAERDYPDFVVTRDSLKATLTPAQLAKGEALRAELAQRYGDAVAKHRMEVQLRVGLMNAFTGSLTGYDGGIVQIHAGACAPLVTIGGQVLPQAGCDNGAALASSYWKPDLYFATRDREWKDFRGHVTVGPVSDVTAKTEAGKADKDAGKPRETTQRQ